MGSGKWKWLVLSAALVFAQGSPSWAVVIAGGDGTGNTSDPGTGVQWANVGALNDGGCEYLGNGWVLTAGHVENDVPGADPIFGSTAYTPDGTYYTLQDPSNTSVNADLVMLHLTTYPPIAALPPISSSQPAFGASITAIGWGLDREPTETYWNSSWQVETEPSTFSGFYLSTSVLAERWGTNTINGTYVGDDGTGTTTSFLTTQFSSTAGPNNMQVASHDSGGGVFYDSSNGWQLTGILLATGIPNSSYDGQPGGTVVFGDLSFFGNLSVYASQINEEVLSNALPGDANLDGRVDINDLTIVLGHYGQTGLTWTQGAFTGDGTVDINDLTIVLANYGATVGGAAAGTGLAAVPEPAAAILLVALVPAMAWAIGRRRRGRAARKGAS